MPALPLPAAARELGTSVPTLRRWIVAGAPVARQGHRGRGCRTLVDPEAIAAWHRICERTAGNDDELTLLRSRVPELLAGAAAKTFDRAPGSRAAAAWNSVVQWQESVVAVLEELGVTDFDDLPIPEAIQRLSKIAAT